MPFPSSWQWRPSSVSFFEDAYLFKDIYIYSIIICIYDIEYM